VKFSLASASKSLVAVSAFALLTSLVPVHVNAQAAAGQAAGQKNYKDRAEYDLYAKITQTTDPKARLELLNTWQDNIRRPISLRNG
jgi:hypothetical protein